MAQLPHFAIQVITPPASEPVSLVQIKQHLRVNFSDEDDLIGETIAEARELVEAWSGRALMPTTFKLVMDRFPLLPNSQFAPGNPSVMAPVVQNTWPLDPSVWAILLPRSPLIAVSSVQYYDTADTLQTMDPATYLIDNISSPPRLAPTTGSYWPSASYRPNAVQVTFQAGYATAALVPAALKRAVKLLVGHFYENREAVSAITLTEAPMAVQSLISAAGTTLIW
jgi:uncharacterized phiE125 gp8 family phage protein